MSLPRPRDLLLIAVAVVAAVALWMFTWSSVNASPPESDIGAIPPRATTLPGTKVLPPLSIPTNPKVVAVGDSWSAGLGVPERTSYIWLMAERLGWDLTLAPRGSGTGWVFPGINNAGTIRSRMSRLPSDADVDLVVLQGSINDDTAAPDESQTLVYNTAVDETIQQARAMYPNAQLVVIGPVSPFEDDDQGVPSFDDRLRHEARTTGFYYVSPYKGKWLESGDQYAKYIDPSTGYHPNEAGQAYLADRTIAAFQELSASEQTNNLPPRNVDQATDAATISP